MDKNVSLAKAIEEATAELDRMRAAFDAHKATAESQLAQEDEAIHRQASLVNSLRIAAERYAGGGGAGLPPEDDDPVRTWWIQAARTDAIVKALEMLGQPVGPTTITEFLHNHGRNDKVAAVSATLSYLVFDNRVQSVGRAQWTVAGQRHPVMNQLARDTRRRLFGPPTLPPERGAAS